MPPRLGVDIGRVISADDEINGISMLSDRWRETALVDNCVAVLHRLLASGNLADQIFLVSKCGPKVEERTRRWLDLVDFFQATGVPEHHVFYVRKRSDKGVVSAKLRISHFIDDRISNLSEMHTVTWRYLFAPTNPPQVPPWVIRVSSWLDFESQLPRNVKAN